MDIHSWLSSRGPWSLEIQVAQSQISLDDQHPCPGHIFQRQVGLGIECRSSVLRFGITALTFPTIKPD
ncbi:hypothetical protein JMJ77_0003480 [Colletotrichum scovillei]|uniref:Uncharacterized protein n=1 Tax=Colletotrichum scovillei TaxID=1209932 RepID=A0A9P7QRA5_9PEZI|nr:hypothetical protein JMJ78_0004990 [Colletotrichum scovillei]KAG7041374.1 hypothetical protein JMJ77_0003480 [Colletotrichum scovillei]KAG7061401.1 hypothetical protein JMJ76_0000965 [Colletotrichum scovillei]